MARIRTIKPEFFTSEDIVEMTPLARLFYVSLWCESDREGRLEWKPGTFKMRYLPGDSCNVSDLASELVERGLIILYEVDGKKYAEIPTFKEHQVINNRESESTIPARVHDASPRVKAEGKEGKEGKGKEGESASPPAPVDKSKAKRKTQLPDQFSVSEAVAAWAKEKGYEQLDAHLDAFMRKAKAKGYTYVDWDLAFMEAIREDWAKLRGRFTNGAAPAPDDTTRSGNIAADTTKKMLDERDKGVKPMPAHIRDQINKALRKEAA